jgi:Zn-dependent peptidase ImmA (M78 family)/DNA-binding transcriptional regulator YiaG
MLRRVSWGTARQRWPEEEELELMPRSVAALVEPSVLRWARESIGLTTLAAARKIGLPDGRVDDWENGTAVPTIGQLRRASAVYKRPLGVFFLPTPPKDFDAMRDFRRHLDATAGSWSPELHGEYRRALAQRDFVLELAELEDTPPSTAWRLANLPENDEELAAAARRRLLDNSPIDLPRGSANVYDILNVWLAALEEVGVLVLATARGGVSTKEMRAFSLHYDLVPVIVVNGSDAPRGRLFSLMHEYMHLLLHTGGLCDTITDTRATTPDRQLEARCNALAAAVLMPSEAVLALPDVISRASNPNSWNYESLREAASPFGVSAEAFLRRLVTLGRVSQSFYNSRRDEFLAAYEQDQSRSRSRTGGNWYRNTARDLGKGYVRRVADAHRRRVLDSYTAASYLNVKVDQIPRLAEAAALRVPAA